MVYDITDRVHELWDYYNNLLDEHIKKYLRFPEFRKNKLKR